MLLTGKTVMTARTASIGRLGRCLWLAAAVALATAGCRQDMHDQPRIEPLEGHSFFENGMGARQPPAGTVARGLLKGDTALWQGRDSAGEFVDVLPVDLDRELLLHGKTRFEIFCIPCHDSTGGGRGMIVRRGFKQPPPLYEDRLKALPLGYFYDVIANGYGTMSSYGRQVPVEDRWAIVAYIRALQIAQGSRLADLPGDLQQEFQTAMATAGDPGAETAAAEDHH